MNEFAHDIINSVINVILAGNVCFPVAPSNDGMGAVETERIGGNVQTLGMTK